MTFVTHVRRCVAVAAAAASLAVPTTAVAYLDPSGIPGSAANPAVQPAVGSGPTESSGFSWEDAGIGAGATVGLIAIAGTGLAMRRSTRTMTRTIA
jgi:hypothetical protein